MTLAYWCVLAAILLPYAFTGFAKFQGGFGLNENKNPREFLEKLGGARKRAHWAQQNSFVLSRVLFGICYIADWASARSLVWFFGMGCIVALFVGVAG